MEEIEVTRPKIRAEKFIETIYIISKKLNFRRTNLRNGFIDQNSQIKKKTTKNLIYVKFTTHFTICFQYYIITDISIEI